MRRKIAATLVLCVLALLGSSAASAGVCHIQLASGDAHSSIAQGFMASLEKRLNSSPSFLLADSLGRFEIEFYLVRAPANDIAKYPSNNKFRAFYVLTDSRKTLITANVKNCSGDGDDCALSAVRELSDTCRRMSNNSFKPTPLRGAA